MTTTWKHLLAATTLIAACAAATVTIDWNGPTRAALMQALSPGKHLVAVMAPPQLSRVTELMQKLKAGIAKNPEWWMKHSKTALAAKQPIPYHANLGMTEDEYREMNRLLDLPWVAAAGLDLDVRLVDNNSLALSGPPQFEGLRIDLEKNVVETAYGTCSTFTRVSRESDSAIGTWSGFRWELNTVHVDKQLKDSEKSAAGVGVIFEIGEREPDGLAIIKYQAKRFREGTLIERADLLVTYPIQ